MKALFRIRYNTRWGETLCMVARDVKYPMCWEDGGVWTLSLPDCSAADLADYTYIVMEDGLVRRTEWRHHSRRVVQGAGVVECEDSWIDCPIHGCPFPREHQAAMFDLPGFRGAGTAVPVFALRTPRDFGIGEFRDLRPLVDWAAATGQCIIQLLPVNDTTRDGGWDDSYPYSPISSFALNPLYINLQDLGIQETADFCRERDALNASSALDYPEVFRRKMAYLREAFAERAAEDVACADFRRFREENAGWLDEYCSFCSKRDGFEEDFYAWTQFHLDRQFSEEVAYARSKGVSFKGDLPIGVSADSADAYWHPDLFNLDSSAGAPPDFFSADGQNWGFPTYNWETMAKDDFAWWKSRLRKMSRYFDAFRIDHILGFFRIWEIPAGHSGGLYGHFNPALPYSLAEIEERGLPLEGLFHEDPRHPGMYQPLITPEKNGLQRWQEDAFYAMYTDFFYHRHEEFWRRNAERKLPELLGATGMLACGEDLGMVPHCVHPVMENERILTFEMANMDKGRPWPYLSVCATSNHDMPTLRMQAVEAGKGDPAPWEIRRILCGHLDSASMLAIFPLQDWVALDGDLRNPDCMCERVNYPADPHNHWKYRIGFNLDELTSEKGSVLRMEVEGLLKDSGRYCPAPVRP